VEVESTEGVNVGRGVKTDSGGAYRLDGLLGGSMTMRASATGYFSQTIGVSLSGTQTLNFDLTPPQPTRFRFFGVVRDGLGNPIRGAAVRSSASRCDLSAVTDSTGRYDATSECASIVLYVQPPDGYEGQQPQYQTPTSAGEKNFVTKRITAVLNTAPSRIPRSDGTTFVSVTVSVSFDDNSNRRLGSQDFVTLQSSDGTIIGTRGADGSVLSIEGLKVGTANVIATYWGAVSPPVTVTVLPMLSYAKIAACAPEALASRCDPVAFMR